MKLKRGPRVGQSQNIMASKGRRHRANRITLTFALICATLVGVVGASPASAATNSHTGSAAAVHLELKNANGTIVCKEYHTASYTKPVATNCPTGTWTEQLFNSNWGRIGNDKKVTVSSPTVSSPTVDQSQENLNQKTLNGAASEAYWTPQKMEAAKEIKTRQTVASQGSTSQKNQANSIPAHMQRRTGRLFFTASNLGDSSCTASIVNTPGGDVIWTAGHCLHINGGWASNVVFVPGYDRGEAPYGVWSARSLWALRGWTKGGNTGNTCGTTFTVGDSRYDFGVAVLNERNGRSIVSTLGGNGLRLNQTASLPVRTYAYDGTTGSNNDGCDSSVATSEKLLTGCSSTTSNPGGREGFFAVSCPQLGPGSSGGGIFTVTDQLVGVVSHTTSNNPSVHYSPLFGQGATNLHNATKDL